MNDLERYFDEVEKAPELARRVDCHHSTLYRIAAGKTRARPKLEEKIEAETGGRVTRAALRAIADQASNQALDRSSSDSAAIVADEALKITDDGTSVSHVEVVAEGSKHDHRDAVPSRRAS